MGERVVGEVYTEERVRASLRAWCNLTSQKAVAAELGVTPSYVAHILKGRKAPSDGVAGALGLKRVVVVQYVRVGVDPTGVTEE